MLERRPLIGGGLPNHVVGLAETRLNNGLLAELSIRLSRTDRRCTLHTTRHLILLLWDYYTLFYRNQVAY
jgi:hypothetical protein